MNAEPYQIDFELPAAPEFISVVRLMVAGMGNSLAFNVEELENLKLAVGEACYQLFLSGVSERSRLLVRSRMTSPGFRVRMSLLHQGDGPCYPFPGLTPKGSRLGLQLLGQLVEEINFSQRGLSTDIELGFAPS